MTYSTYSAVSKSVFISFDFDHDRIYRYLLSALNENSRFNLRIFDLTPSEIQSSNVGRIKAVLTSKLSQADVCLVIVGAYANSLHADRALIGSTNWQWWEIEQAKLKSKKLVGVKLKRENPSPVPLLNSNAKWAHSFDVSSIIAAVERA